MIKSIIFLIIKFFTDFDSKFGWWDVYCKGVYRGTVLAFGKNHAIDKIAKYNAYLRDTRLKPIAFNQNWKAQFSYTPISDSVRKHELDTRSCNHLHMLKARKKRRKSKSTLN